MRKTLALVLAFALSFGTTAMAANLWELRDSSNVTQGNITDAATPVIEQMDLAGNADTATALAANGSNCSSGQAPLGVDEDGAVESCFDVETDTEATSHEGTSSAHHAATTDTNAGTICTGTGNYLDGEGNCDALVTDQGDQTITLTGDVTGSGTGSFAATIAASAVTTSKLSADAVTAVKVLNGTLTEAKLAFDTATEAELTTHAGLASVHHTATTDTNADTICSGTGNYLDGEGNCDALITALPNNEGSDTTANICDATPGATGRFMVSTDDFDLYTSTGAALPGQWRNSRTGLGPC